MKHTIFCMFHKTSWLAQKSITEYRQSIDWDLWESKPYVVVDPADPNELLYLSAPAYNRLLGQAISNAIELVVVARPTSKRPAKPSGDSPSIKEEKRIRPRKGAGTLAKRLEASPASTLASSFFTWNKWLVRKGSLVLPTERNLSGLIGKWGKLLHYWSGKTSKGHDYANFAIIGRHLVDILSKQGIRGVILRMKVATLVLYKYVGGERVTDTGPLGLRIKMANGLPAFLPLRVRHGIRTRSTRVIRVFGSLLTAYKAFYMPSNAPDFTSIEGTPGTSSTQFQAFVPEFWRRMFALGKLPRKPIWLQEQGGIMCKFKKVYETYFSVSAGPNNKIALQGAQEDAWAWKYYTPESQEPLPLQWYRLINHTTLINLFTKMYSEPLPDWTPRGSLWKLGKLAFREEAAGKLRIFAIVDYWTQAALRPLHQWIFSWLSVIPTDATFDQEGAIESLLAEGHTEYYAYDLKSATDNIPLCHYVDLLSHIIGSQMTQLWADLLVDRDYFTPPNSDGDVRAVRYTRGQPMGALSSWASLALLHHAVVQYAWFRLGKDGWATGYRVLGDDIVIAGILLAQEYKKVCEELGIPIGLAKGIESNRALVNFANQYATPDANLSPISLKEELAVRLPAARFELVARLLRRGWVAPCYAKALKLTLSPRMWEGAVRDLSKGRMTPALTCVLRLLLTPTSPVAKKLADNSSPVVTWLRTFGTSSGLLGDLSNKAMSSELDNNQILSLLSGVSKMVLRDLEKKMSNIDRKVKEFDLWALQTSLPAGYTDLYRFSMWRSLERTRDLIKAMQPRLEAWRRTLCPDYVREWHPTWGVPPTGDAPYIGSDRFVESFEELLEFHSSLPDYPEFKNKDPLEQLHNIALVNNADRPGHSRPSLLERALTKTWKRSFASGGRK